MSTEFFHSFESDIQQIHVPKSLNFPFYYQANELAVLAAQQIQVNYLEKNPWGHNFGLDREIKGLEIGKMFGVLVVENKQGEIGFLAGFSGKLADSNHHQGFVPPVFDILEQKGFYKQGELEISAINTKLEALECSAEYRELKTQFEASKSASFKQTTELKQEHKKAKQERDRLRKEQMSGLNEADRNQLEIELKKESIEQSYQLKKLKIELDSSIEDARIALEHFESTLNELREERRQKSFALQQKIFSHYTFLNAEGAEKSLLDIFQEVGLELPPAGAGECAAPKLFQYAYLNGFRPITFAEFWWGASPKSEVKKHKEFYPSCRGKCEPILGHMLQGIEVDENPMLNDDFSNKEIDIIYEDESIVVVNKPEEFLSVPGIHISDSVQTRLQNRNPENKELRLVHRLDMSTSGILIAAKTEGAYKILQRQFITRRVIKRYVAVLLSDQFEKQGTIKLPLRVDLENRPKQLVCYEHGKDAVTEYEVIETTNGRTRVYFFPKTGRTHQLRVHAAHSDGLNAPILGDDLYGTPAERLHLHAEYIQFRHPLTRELIEFHIPAPF